MLFVGSKDLPAMLKLEPEAELAVPTNGTPEQKGLAIYQAKCQLCHHGDLKGQPPAVPSLVHVSARLDKDQVEAMVTHGKGLMPAFDRLSESELSELTAFLFADHPVLALKPEVKQGLSPVNRYRSGFGFMLTSNGLSPIAPPWASLTAYDLNKGTIKWKVPVGDVPGIGVKGTGVHYPKYGPVVTAGGLIFTGTRDRIVRALDEEDGKVVWETELPEGMEGIPAVYEIDGREFIVFCSAAQFEIRGTVPIKNGAYVAFALPTK
jgi:quinoprotein glucose dehydrogenase